VIVYPKNQEQWALLARFLNEYAHVQPSADLKVMAYVTGQNRVLMVVGFNAFMGSVAQIHIAFAPGEHYTPKAMLPAVFNHGFNDFNRKKLIGIVNSKNERAMKYDLHLGFVEEYRMPGMHDDGGDIVILSMTKEQCRYLENADGTERRVA